MKNLSRHEKALDLASDYLQSLRPTKRKWKDYFLELVDQENNISKRIGSAILAQRPNTALISATKLLNLKGK